MNIAVSNLYILYNIEYSANNFKDKVYLLNALREASFTLLYNVIYEKVSQYIILIQ